MIQRLILLAVCLPLTVFAGEDSSKIKRQHFSAKTTQSYVKYDVKDCVQLIKRGKFLHGSTMGGVAADSYGTECPKEKPVMVSTNRAYAIQSGYLSALTGVAQSSAVICCPLAREWVDVKNA